MYRPLRSPVPGEATGGGTPGRHGGHAGYCPASPLGALSAAVAPPRSRSLLSDWLAALPLKTGARLAGRRAGKGRARRHGSRATAPDASWVKSPPEPEPGEFSLRLDTGPGRMMWARRGLDPASVWAQRLRQLEQRLRVRGRGEGRGGACGRARAEGRGGGALPNPARSQWDPGPACPGPRWSHRGWSRLLPLGWGRSGVSEQRAALPPSPCPRCLSGGAPALRERPLRHCRGSLIALPGNGNLPACVSINKIVLF